MTEREKLEEEIRRVAYEIYVQSGCIPGRDLDNWLEAERIVLEKYGIKKTKKSVPSDKPATVKKSKKTVQKKGASIKKRKGKAKSKK